MITILLRRLSSVTPRFARTQSGTIPDAGEESEEMESLYGYAFPIDEAPQCMWGGDIIRQNRTFLGELIAATSNMWLRLMRPTSKGP